LQFFYGYETWFLTLREEHTWARRLRVFEKRIQRKIFEQGDEMVRGWKKFHGEEPHYLLPSPNIIRMAESRMMRWVEHVVRMGKKRNAYKILVGTPEGKRPLGRPRHRWEDNTKIYLRERGWDAMDWFDLAQDMEEWRAFNAVVNLEVP
jgi:hypothetical protein